MTAKELLQSYQNERKEILRLYDHYRELRDLAENTTVDLTSEKVQSSGSRDRLGDLMAKMSDIEQEILKKTVTSLDSMEQVERAIIALEDGTERLVLQDRYIKGLPWSEIEENHHYSRGRLMQIHAEALKKIIMTE